MNAGDLRTADELKAELERAKRTFEEVVALALQADESMRQMLRAAAASWVKAAALHAKAVRQ